MRWFLILVGGLIGGGVMLLRQATRNVTLELPELRFAKRDVRDIVDEVIRPENYPSRSGAPAPAVTLVRAGEEPLEEMVVHVIHDHAQDLPDTLVKQAFDKALHHPLPEDQS